MASKPINRRYYSYLRTWPYLRAWPCAWLMTDARLGADCDLPQLIAGLPKNTGVIFRHYHLEATARHHLFQAVLRVCRAQRRKLLLADSPQKAKHWGADGWHQSTNKRPERRVTRSQIHSAAVHNQREILRAKTADMLLLSPLYPTKSHPEACHLGRLRFANLRNHSTNRKQLIFALGGMNCVNYQRVKRLLRLSGYAAIDSFLPASVSK